MWIDERTLHNPVLEVRADAVIDRGPSAVVAIAARFRPVPSSGRAPWSNAAPITTAGQPVPGDADGESRCDRGADGDGSALEGDAGQRRLGALEM